MKGIPSITTADAYVDHVGKVTRNDPGRRAALRRSLGRPVADIGARWAHGVVAPWLPERRDVRGRRVYDAVESAYYTVAALAAARPADRDRETDQPATPEADAAADNEESARTNLGRVLGLAVRDGKVNPDTAEGRLHLLCRQDVAGLHRQLPGLIRLLQAKDVQVDLAKLLLDLSRWGIGRDEVAKQWLQGFYRAMNELKDNDDQDAARQIGQESEDK
ncbi:type I-E CRISPR-associated protein Cse2/CasB (plasmid) [Sphaerimonospora sp. CA-214678]|uniref:type I-E CRISPR-associated protein Cse2/CasB n=1 Tax=Sphaerimonospora sp. CA-214678 TaxID=3240029 RepID=UPI003D8EDFA7